MTLIYIDDAAVPLIEGAGGGCFSADTQISIETGTISISEIEVGDTVWSYDEIGTLVLSKVTETFYHPLDSLYRVVHECGYLDITPNHWVLKEDGSYQELKDFNVGDSLLTDNNKLSKIISIDFLREDEVYNFKVSHLHAYIANGIKVHNGGGGGKGGSTGGHEDPNTLFSTDVLFLTMGLGEGPVYRINPNGPQDIEVNEGNIDDLVNYNTPVLETLGGGVKTDRLFILSNTGSITQQTLPFFGDAIYTPQRLQGGLDLKKGNVTGVPRSSLDNQATSVAAITALKFYFICQAMQLQDSSGNIVGSSVDIKVTVYDSIYSKEIKSVSKTIKGKTNVGYSFDLYIAIPAADISSLGYRFTVEKTSDDSDSSKRQDAVTIQGWTEITEIPIAYTRTATIGYAIKAFAEHKGSLPALTNMVKGLLVKVPSNYNQPILENGDIDWRQVEVGTDNWTSDGTTGGYYQQKTNAVIQSGVAPRIYEGIWDGQFVYSWTQNPAWIIYDMLTNTSYGLGIPEKNIDKYSFYDAAVYCDACDVTTGRFVGVDALADSTYRYKPRGYKRGLLNTLSGLPSGYSVKERRFILDAVISDQKQIMDIINNLSLTFRAILYYTGGKIALYQDRPDDMPIAVFNETNIIAGTFNISGVGEESLLTGVDITYNEATNHYRRETLRIDDAKALRERNSIENIAKIDLTGITRKSQALRLAQYIIAESKYSRRKVGFKSGIEASEIYPGAVVSISQKSTSVNWGYGGLVSNTSAATEANVYLEYIGNPPITTTFFTANTSPLILRIASSNSGLIDSYLISNNLANVSFINSGNVYSGSDIVKVRAIAKYNHPTKSFTTFSGTWNSSHNPTRRDLWTLGTITNPSNIYSVQSDKLFRVINIKRDKDETVFIEAKEYINNVYIDSDSIINYQPLFYNDFFSPLQPPPLPNFTLSSLPKRDIDGSIYNDIEISSFTDTTGYSKEIKTEFFHAAPNADSSLYLIANTNVSGSRNIINLKIDNMTGLEDGLSATLIGKNGFSTEIGTIRLLATAKSKVNITLGNPTGEIQLTVPGLRGLINKNYSGIHIFDTISPITKNIIGIPVTQKVQDATIYPGFINYISPYNDITVPVISYSQASDTLNISNPKTGTKELYEILPTEVFYITIKQPINQSIATNNVYITGSSYQVVRTNTITTSNMTASKYFYQPLGISVKHKDFVDVYINGDYTSAFTLQTGADGLANSLVYIDVSSNLPTADASLSLEVSASKYNIPLIEIGDNIVVTTGDVYSIRSTSYDTLSPTYNAWMTSNNIYMVNVASQLTSTTYNSDTAINISSDPTGTINNVNIANKTLTFDYTSNNYAGIISLGNSVIYTLSTPALTYKPVPFGDSVARVINRAVYGTHFIRGRNVNKYGRRSPLVAKSVTVTPLRIKGVDDLDITEELFLDSSFVACSRAIISFTPLDAAQEVTDYEVSYKVDTAESLISTTYQTIKVSASGADPDGIIRIRVDNIDVGSGNRALNDIVARVTPLNRTIRGSTVSKRLGLKGKTLSPLNVVNFTAGQSLDQLVLSWEFVKNPKNASLLYDLDLYKTTIKRVPGLQDLGTADFTLLWTTGEVIAEVTVPNTTVFLPIVQYGQYTYLAKTIDTTGNESDTIIGATFTSIEATNLTTYKVYSEDAPSDVYVTGITNSNYGEYTFPSFANSNNYGLYKAYSPSVPGSFNASLTDNANGTSTGWSVIGGSPSDLKALTTATYRTSIRDLGAVVTSGSLVIDLSGYQGIKSTWVDQMTTIGEGVAESYQPTDPTLWGRVLRDDNFIGSLGIGNTLGFSNTAVATPYYDRENRTIVSGADPNTIGIAANVFAITTGYGNYVGDVANANIICFINGTVNANAIILGNSFYANGQAIPTGNGFANLSISGSKYRLVNLNQWADLDHDATFVGTPGDIVTNTEFRLTTSDPYDVNHVVLNSVFTTTAGSDGFTQVIPGLRNFRYIQLKHNVINNNPSQVDYTLDRFRYKILLEPREYSPSVTVDTAIKFIDYSSMAFTRVPKVSAIVVESSNHLAIPMVAIKDRGLGGANISVFFSSNGVSAHDIISAPVVDFKVIGV